MALLKALLGGDPLLVLSTESTTGRDGDGFGPPPRLQYIARRSLNHPNSPPLLPPRLFLGDSWRSRVQYVVIILNLAASADVCRLCTAPGSFTTNVRV